MFFFFAGGVSKQVRHVIKPAAARCIACNSRADLVEYDNVLKLFFVPVWKWPGKGPNMHCNSCGVFFPHITSPQEEAMEPLRCGRCLREVDSEFVFCPYCGYQL